MECKNTNVASLKIYLNKEEETRRPSDQTLLSKGINPTEFDSYIKKLRDLCIRSNKKRNPIEIQRVAIYTSFVVLTYAFFGFAKILDPTLIPERHDYLFPLSMVILAAILPWIVLGYITTREDNRMAWKSLATSNTEFVDYQLIVERKLGYKNIRTLFEEDFKGVYIQLFFDKQQVKML
ncbi:hypothetical protein AKO1_005756 [Acrasis kona]|uniref:Uncharacterized protein n=1 Tax=Acrasis kona TaxID=1008807 RepID=A0AAW2YL60_9EUKA